MPITSEKSPDNPDQIYEYIGRRNWSAAGNTMISFVIEEYGCAYVWIH